MQKFLKNKQGVTLIALVITIVIIVILAAVSINMLIGDNGLITKAHQSSKQMQIASGKEEIDLQVLDLVTGKVLKGESCSLEYIKQELPKRLNLSVTGEKGEPLQAIYVDYKNYEYEIDNQFIVKYAGEGNYKERPTLTLSLDKTQTGVEKVIITAEAEIIDGTIEEIKNPKGESKKGNNTTYEVTKNGEYTFIATSNRGRVTSKTINVNNIKEQGTDLTGIITGEDKHNHIYETNYDNNNHWKECIICGNKINVASHNKIISGNPATCDDYVTLGREICSDNCGFDKQIEKLEHIRPEKLNWQNYLGKEHIAFQCERCGGNGSNSVSEKHTFNINGKIMTVPQMINEGLDVHKYGTQQCTKCKINVDLSGHTFYSTYCYLCDKPYGPTSTAQISENSLHGNKVKIDLINNDVQYVYVNVDTKGLEYYDVTASSLFGGNYNVGTPELIEKQGNVWKYKIPVSLKDKSKNMTENINILFNWYSNIGIGDSLDGIKITDISAGNLRTQIPVYTLPVNTKPTIDNIEQINEETSGEWTTKKKLKIKGTCPKREIVYISMYDDTGKIIFEDKATQVVNGNYEFTSDYGIEAFGERNFTIKVKDMFENEEQRILTLSKVDSKAPLIISNKEYNKEWSKNKKVELEIEEKGIGKVQIAFNDENNYQNVEQKDGKYLVNYNFIGDIYEDIQGAIYLKDGLGNIRTEKIKIGKIDNTSPTITNVETRKEGEKTIVVTINANDINEKIGKEGSGISGYAISTSKELPTDISYGKSNEIKVEKAGTYYIYVKDNVGNVSARYELNV